MVLLEMDTAKKDCGIGRASPELYLMVVWPQRHPARLRAREENNLALLFG